MAGSKKSGGAKAAPLRDRRRSSSRSRHSTPISALTDSTAPPTPQIPNTSSASTAVEQPASLSDVPPAPPTTTPYLNTPTTHLLSSLDPAAALLIPTTATTKSGDPPSASELHALHDRIRDSVGKTMEKRGEVCDRAMRQLVQRRQRVQREREAEAERVAAAEAVNIKREDEERRKKIKKEKGVVSRKRSIGEVEDGERDEKLENLPNVGAHGLARQDGVGVNDGALVPPSPPVLPGTVDTDPMDTAPDSPSSPSSSAPQPTTIPLYERAFGKDPTKTHDDTIYDIRPITPEMTLDDKRQILNVLWWPEGDLSELTAGDPPDMDFSNAKPANQVNFSTFQTYVEPYIRPLTEEDVAFLRERGDRVTPYIIPVRGAKSYKDIWAAEDGLTGIEPPAKHESDPNEARGSMEEMDDGMAETDEISMGPVMERLLSLVRPAPNTGVKKEETTEPPLDANGDTSMLDGDASQQDQALPGAEEPHRPLTALPFDAPRPLNLPALDYETLDQRALQELRHIGFLSPASSPPVQALAPASGAQGNIPDYAAQNDDEVSARLRTLQHELRRLSRLNNIRRARVLELTEERMAMQEYTNIAEDLDGQVNAAYLKRNRGGVERSKPPTKKQSAAAAARGGSGHGRGVAVSGGRGVSEGVRQLMVKRKDWIEMVGPVVAFGRGDVLADEETVFGAEKMKAVELAEREAERGEVEEG